MSFYGRQGCLWICMGVCGFLGVYRYLWVTWVFMDVYGCLSVSMGTYRCL